MAFTLPDPGPPNLDFESPADREKSGKPRVATLILTAERDRATVLIRVTDDGRGIDQARVLRLVPGLERAEFVRFGMVHRNTYVNGPTVLADTWQVRHRPHRSFECEGEVYLRVTDSDGRQVSAGPYQSVRFSQGIIFSGEVRLGAHASADESAPAAGLLYNVTLLASGGVSRAA